ncbi:MAG TPA: glutamate formiminotransferase [Candidatus Dormibacteraeota bacterium]
METVELFESVPNFSEGRNAGVIDAIAAAAAPAHLLDVDRDRDHHRVVITLLAEREPLVDGLVASIAAAAERIDLRDHAGVHPRVGAADVVPIVPMGNVTLDECHDVAHELGERVWSELQIPVYFYGYDEEWSLADIRAGRAQPDLGASLHPTAGAVCVGARRLLVAFNVLLPGATVTEARAIARSIRESGGGMRGVQALVFELPGERMQLSMNLFRVDEAPPASVIEELERRGIELGEQQVVGLCPAIAANAAATGHILEARIGSAVAAAAARRVPADDEGRALARRLRSEAAGLKTLGPSQEELLAGAERCAALPPVLQATGVLDAELESMARLAANGLREALTESTRSTYAARMAALDRRLD